MSRRAALALAVLTALAGSLGAAYAAGLAVASVHLGGASATTPVMYPVSVTIANKAGGKLGKAENGDIITLVFAEPVDASTMCSGWPSTTTSQTLSYQWSVQPGTPDDQLVASGTSATCSSGLHVGTIDLGAAGYNTSTTAIDFTTTKSVLSVGTTTTLTVTLNGAKNGAAAAIVTSGSNAIWTPDAAVTDRSGRSCGVNLARSTATVQF